MNRTIALTTIGSDCVEIEVAPSALPEAPGGVTLWVRHWPGTPLAEQTAYTLTGGEAKDLAAAVADAITPTVIRLPARPEPNGGDAA